MPPLQAPLPPELANAIAEGPDGVLVILEPAETGDSEQEESDAE